MDPLVIHGWYLMREMEAGCADLGDMTALVGLSEARWTAPVSKTDIAAKSCMRSHGCGCRKQKDALCPFHAVKRHIADNVEPIQEEFSALEKEKEDRWSWHPKQLELLEGSWEDRDFVVSQRPSQRSMVVAINRL